MPLTDITVRQARPADKAYTLSDGRGLRLCVTPSGGKHWHFRCSCSGKQHRMTLGAYPEISLKEARELREAARAQVARNIHPQKHRKQEQLVKRLAENRRFQGVFEQWLSHRSHALQPGRQSTLGQIERIFTRDILPTLAKHSIYEITQADLLQVLGKIEAREALTTAEKCRSWLHAVLPQRPISPPTTVKEKVKKMEALYKRATSLSKDQREHETLNKVWTEWYRPTLGVDIDFTATLPKTDQQ